MKSYKEYLKESKQSYKFRVKLAHELTDEQLDKIDKAGIIDFPVILDQIGNLHLLLEKHNGTSPPEHVIYSFLEYS